METDPEQEHSVNPRQEAKAALQKLSSRPGWDALAAVATNELQSAVAARYPVVEAYCDRLRRAGARLAMMSGSGSAVFGLFDEEPDVVAIERACNARVIATRVPARVVGHLSNE